MNDFVELHRVIKIIMKRWWLLAGLTAIAAAMGYYLSQRQTPVYEATATVLVGEISQSSNLSREDIQMSELFAQTYADLAVRQPVLQGVVETLGMDGTWEDLRKRVRVASIEGTQLIEIQAQANSPDTARLIADEVAKNLISIGLGDLSNREGNITQDFIRQQMEATRARILTGQQRIEGIETALDESPSGTNRAVLQTERAALERLIADDVMNYVELSNLTAQKKNSNSLSVIESAYTRNSPIRPRIGLNILLSGGLGILVALGIILFWEFLDDTLKTKDDIRQFKELNLLGAIGRIEGREYSDKLIAHLEPFSPTIESYRMVRNRINFNPAKNPLRSILITSAESGEGKSITAANLGLIMAQANRKTILVDADFRRPVLHQVFKVENDTGLGDMLDSTGIELSDCLKDTHLENLYLLTNGKQLWNSSELLGSERMKKIIKDLEQNADVVIFDSSPALLTADAAILSNLANGVIIVIRAGKSKRKAVEFTLLELQKANANIFGCIINQIYRDEISAYYKGYKPEANIFRRLRTLVFKSSLYNERDQIKLPAVKTKEINRRPHKKYFVSLSDKDREMVLELISAKTLSNRLSKRAMILLKADHGLTDSQIMASIHVSRSLVERVRKQFVIEGIEEVLIGDPKSNGKT
jgi:non-specific protein-tyrosine kinase